MDTNGKDPIEIIHLSDLHYGARDASVALEKVWQYLRDNKIVPDVIVVTGDIVEAGFNLKASLKKACNDLFNLANNCGLNPNERLFVIPGNHDYRYWGNLTIPGVFGQKAFKKYFTCYNNSRIAEGLRLFVACIDSNRNKHRVNFATGRIADEDLINFNRDIEPYREDDTIKKIALLHHHPLPILKAEGDESNSILQGFDASVPIKAFDVLENGASFLQEMLLANVNLVLHGHKHERGMAKASFPLGKSNLTRFIGVVAAGALGITAESSWNIIELYESGRVKVQFLTFDEGRKKFIKKKNDTHELFSREELRANQLQEQRKNAPTLASKVVEVITIIDLSGDAKKHTYIQDWRASQAFREQPLKELPFFIESAGGLFVNKPEIISHHKDYTAYWEPDKSPPQRGKQKGKICFNPCLPSDISISAEIIQNVPNAISFTREERLSLTDGRHEKDWVTGPTRNYSSDMLIMDVRFPSNFDPRSFEVTVDKIISNQEETYVPDHDETDYLSTKYHRRQRDNSVILHVSNPLFMRKYKIAWELNGRSVSEDRRIDLRAFGKSENFIRKLAQISPKDCDKCDEEMSEIRIWLGDIHDKITNMEVLKNGNEERKMEVRFIIFDKYTELSNEDNDTKYHKLRCAAFYCPFCERPSELDIWERDTYRIGEIFAGAAWKRKEVLFGFSAEGFSKDFDVYIGKPQCPKHEAKSYKAVIAIPLSYPLNSDNVVAILELRTCAISPLLFNLHGPKYKTIHNVGAFAATLMYNLFPNIIFSGKIPVEINHQEITSAISRSFFINLNDKKSTIEALKITATPLDPGLSLDATYQEYLKTLEVISHRE
jgi:hypothetical protein